MNPNTKYYIAAVNLFDLLDRLKLIPKGTKVSRNTVADFCNRIRKLS
jgi:hypothetical protein